MHKDEYGCICMHARYQVPTYIRTYVHAAQYILHILYILSILYILYTPYDLYIL